MKKNSKKITQPVLEVAAGNRREIQEKFFLKFSEIQVNVVLLFILAATFLITGISKYAELIGTEALRTWLGTLIISIMYFTLSVFFITMSNVFHPLKIKRISDFISFVAFISGALIFFVSLIVMLFILYA